MKKYLITLLIMPVLLSSAAAAPVDYQKQVELLQKVQKALIGSGITAKDGALIIEEPARSIYHFGAVLDQEFQVVAVTPESDAARMGIREADILLAINQQQVTENSLANILAQMNDLADGDRLLLQINRGQKPLTLQGSVTRQVIPGWRLQLLAADEHVNETPSTASCGFVSVFFNTPASLQRHPVKINEIKAIDFSAGLTYRATDEVLKVPVGEIQVTVQEHIPSETIRRYRGDLIARNFGAVKTFTLQVEPNTVYHLAAEYFSNRNERASKGEYWQPVVWKTTARNCS